MENNVTKLKYKQILYTLQYGLNPKNRPDIYVVLAILGIIVSYIILSPSLSAEDILSQKAKSDMFGLMIEGITVAVVISVWFSDLARDWTEQLEKYLSVKFDYEGNTRIEEKFVRLISESDIRQMAQSLGQSWNNGNRLPIKPAIKTLKKTIMQDSSSSINEGKPFCLFDVTIELTEDQLKPKARPTPPDCKCYYPRPENKENGAS